MATTEDRSWRVAVTLLCAVTVLVTGLVAMAPAPGASRGGEPAAAQTYLLRDEYFIELRDSIRQTGAGDAIYINTPGMHWIATEGCGSDAPENNQILCELRGARDRGAAVRLSVGEDIVRPSSSEYALAVPEFLDQSGIDYRINGRHAKLVVIERGGAGDNRDAFIGSHNLTLHSLTNYWSTLGPAEGVVSNETSVVYRVRPWKGRPNDPAVADLIDRAQEFLDDVWDGTLTHETEPAPGDVDDPSPYLLIGQQFIDAVTRHLDSAGEGDTVDLMVYVLGEQEGEPAECGWVSSTRRCDSLLIDALIGATERGAEVRMIVDDRTFAAAVDGAVAVERLMSGGVQMRLDPCAGGAGAVCMDHLGALTHSKQLVINDAVAYIGSQNYYHGSETTGLNGMGETAVRTSAPHVLRRATDHFNDVWTHTREIPRAQDCGTHLAVGADVTASSAFSAARGPEHAVDGECNDDSRWLSAEGDPTPTLTIDLGATTDIDAIDVYSGFGWPVASPGHVLVDFSLEAHTANGWETIASFVDNTDLKASWQGDVQADRVRLVVTTPSRSLPHVTRVYQVAVHGPDH
jgi:phosphatidylserine/phosphatidylglycerophosphate/cardiolipin synthase-like enzyme